VIRIPKIICRWQSCYRGDDWRTIVWRIWRQRWTDWEWNVSTWYSILSWNKKVKNPKWLERDWNSPCALTPGRTEARWRASKCASTFRYSRNRQYANYTPFARRRREYIKCGSSLDSILHNFTTKTSQKEKYYNMDWMHDVIGRRGQCGKYHRHVSRQSSVSAAVYDAACNVWWTAVCHRTACGACKQQLATGDRSRSDRQTCSSVVLIPAVFYHNISIARGVTGDDRRMWREWDVLWDSHLCGRGRYVEFVPASSIFPQFAASATYILVSILTVNRYT